MKSFSTNPPVLIVPGCYGSKFNIINQQTGEKTRAWFYQKFFPEILQGEAAINFLWSKINPDGSVQSYIRDFATFEVERGRNGQEGVDRFFESKIMSFVNAYYLAYMDPIYNALKKRLKYQLGTDFFSFPYDWRQPIFNNQIIDELCQTIDDIFCCTKKQVCLICHSGGLAFIKAYMAKYPQFQHSVSSIISINSPHDGAGGYGSISGISGYNLQMPIQTFAMKGLECLSASMCPYLTQPVDDFIQKDDLLSCVFVKKLKQSQNFESCSYGAIEERLNPSLLDIDISQLRILTEKFANERKIIDAPSLLLHLALSQTPKPLYLHGFVKLMLPAINPKYLSVSDIHNQFKVLYNPKAIAAKLIEREQSKSLVKDLNQDFNWEVFAAGHSQRTREISNKFLQLNHETGYLIPTQHCTESYYRIIREGFSEIFYSTDSELIKELTQARVLWQERTGYQQQYLEQNPVRQVLAADQVALINPRNMETPWRQSQKPEEIQELFELYDRVHEKGSVDDLFFGQERWHVRLYEQFVQGMRLSPPAAFRYYAIISAGLPTPLHLVYQTPVCDYSQLVLQKPTFFFVDGDGLIPLHSAGGCGFPDHLVGGKWILPHSAHFPAVQNERTFDIVEEVLRKLGAGKGK